METDLTLYEFVIGLMTLGILTGLYMLPTFVAGIRGSNQVLAIFFLNLLLGWTFLGWVISLVWACADISRQREQGRVLE
jgi:T4 superinfection immunity protein